MVVAVGVAVTIIVCVVSRCAGVSRVRMVAMLRATRVEEMPNVRSNNAQQRGQPRLFWGNLRRLRRILSVGPPSESARIA